MKTKLVRFNMDLHGCINHACTAEIVEDAPEYLVAINWWSDGHSRYEDNGSEKLRVAIEETSQEVKRETV